MVSIILIKEQLSVIQETVGPRSIANMRDGKPTITVKYLFVDISACSKLPAFYYLFVYQLPCEDISGGFIHWLLTTMNYDALWNITTQKFWKMWIQFGQII